MESLRRISQKFAGHGHGRSLFRLFLDDRSWFCEKRSTCLDIGREWLREVTLWGLGENKSKADFGVVGSAEDRRSMQMALRRRQQVGEVRLRPRLLGTSLQLNRAHGKPAKEENLSLDKARQMADWGRHLPGDQGRKAKFLKATAIGAIAAPWYVRLENLEKLRKLQTKLSGAYRTSGHQRGGLLHLLLDGHAASTLFRHGVVATVQVLMQNSLPVLRRAWGRARTNGPLALARRWLKRHGWEETDRWKWRHPLTQCCLVTEAPRGGPVGNTVVLTTASKDQIGHALREAWRANTWQAWLKLRRRRGLSLTEVPWGEVSKRLKFLRTAKESLPQDLRSHAVSQAAWHSMCQEPMEPCWMCGAPVPTLHHSLWECPAFQQSRPPAHVRDVLTDELCWPKVSDKAAKVLLHGALVRRELLSRRLRESN